MNKGWLELESDPGLFTLLLEDFGVKGIHVEEIYDLQKPIDGTVYGFIFLFRWIEERRSRRKTEDEPCVMDEETVNSIFFAKQIIPNSCATHALLSVLLNSGKVRLGETLEKFKEFTSKMSPDDKGYAIGNMPELARAHNSHARPEPRHLPEKQPGMSTTRTMEAFHFVSYVPINGRLFELDGLKPYPIDHGPCESNQYWTEKFRSVIIDRLGMATGGEPYHDIRFNLMAVVPCKRQLYEHKLSTLKTNRQIVLEALQQMVKVTSPGLTAMEKGTNFTLDEKDSVECARYKLLNSSESVRECPRPSVPNHSGESLDVEMKEEPITENGRTDGSDIVTRDKNMKIQISMKEGKDGSITIPKTVSLTDVTKPLTIETKFGGSSGPNSESTDTASEVGSVFSSPGSFNIPSCQSSPQFLGDDVKLEDEAGLSKSDGMETRHKSRHRFSSSQGFSPKDLLDLLKNVENEIDTCEANLKDENEKRKKYKIDDCRRTHNYDQFLMTFLSMLAEQGHLATLVADNVNAKKRQGANIGRLQPKPLTSRNDKRRRSRSRRRR